ncbi:MAG TPA: hypothetical protein VEJ38_15205 [Candidatus Acidoferrales bacterium]|nr:hypothetical protein [Candidatus Acidoferrales bacterium]
MSLFDWFGKECSCPECRQRVAKQFMGKVKCRNVNCPNYDREFAQKSPMPMGSTQAPTPLPRFSGNFDPGSNRIEIRYRNFRGDEQTYVGDRRTLRRRGQHVSICLAPAGRRATFALKWVISPSGLEGMASASEADGPNAKERRVLAYHEKRGTTSTLYEALRKKYPDF